MNELYLPEGAYIGTRANDEAMASLENLIRAKALGTVLEARVQLCDGAHDRSCAEHALWMTEHTTFRLHWESIRVSFPAPRRSFVRTEKNRVTLPS